MLTCPELALLLMSANIGSRVPSKTADSADLSIESRRALFNGPARVVAGQGTPSPSEKELYVILWIGRQSRQFWRGHGTLY